ncbi:MAG: hypothetical protein D6690_03405 [Nitrospirae bacterium]|nr:MAG: hypothetical protein D6690_03405 [Nitrospirota bacterium]
MQHRIMEAYKEVERAMERYNAILDEYVLALQTQEGSNAKQLERMKAGTKAMRDSSMIYLSYAKFVAYGMPESEDLVEDDLQM